MSSYYVYIIYSRQINRYYVGSSGDVGRRIQEHNEGLYAGSFSKQSKDWELYLQIECKDIIHARKVEEHLFQDESMCVVFSNKDAAPLGLIDLRCVFSMMISPR